jgi:outer membrane protein W
MKRRILFTLCLIVIIATANAQQVKPQKSKYANLKFNKSSKEKDFFLKKQWWLGMKGGTNLSKPVVQKQFSVVSPINYDLTTSEKKYKSYKQFGSQVTLEVTFYYKGFNASFQPTYRHIGFDYSNHYAWESSVESRKFIMDYKQQQRVDYLDFPFLGKYEHGIRKVRPYVQAGIWFSHLVNADKTVSISKTDFASGSPDKTSDEPIVVGANDLFAKNYWGLLGGVGLNYNVGNVRLNFDVQYKHGLSNISSSKNRYGNDRLSGVGDSLDDLRLNNLAISVGCLFPLRFLEKDFKSLDKK